MADIELVIKMSEEMYAQIIDENDIDTMLIPYKEIIKNGIPIPKGITNGNMIKAMFPNTESKLDEKTGIILVKWADGTTKTFKASWWNALYNTESEG